MPDRHTPVPRTPAALLTLLDSQVRATVALDGEHAPSPTAVFQALVHGTDPDQVTLRPRVAATRRWLHRHQETLLELVERAPRTDRVGVRAAARMLLLAAPEPGPWTRRLEAAARAHPRTGCDDALVLAELAARRTARDPSPDLQPWRRAARVSALHAVVLQAAQRADQARPRSTTARTWAALCRHLRFACWHAPEQVPTTLELLRAHLTPTAVKRQALLATAEGEIALAAGGAAEAVAALRRALEHTRAPLSPVGLDRMIMLGHAHRADGAPERALGVWTDARTQAVAPPACDVWLRDALRRRADHLAELLAAGPDATADPRLSLLRLPAPRPLAPTARETR
ncbi:hypothetical protein LV78_005408 [Actinosynnema pretiosum]|nr:hypothetical protein [Actinosynnema pretiosum]